MVLTTLLNSVQKSSPFQDRCYDTDYYDEKLQNDILSTFKDLYILMHCNFRTKVHCHVSPLADGIADVSIVAVRCPHHTMMEQESVAPIACQSD